MLDTTAISQLGTTNDVYIQKKNKKRFLRRKAIWFKEKSRTNAICY
jgi:hypothetical protein